MGQALKGLQFTLEQQSLWGIQTEILYPFKSGGSPGIDVNNLPDLSKGTCSQSTLVYLPEFVRSNRCVNACDPLRYAGSWHFVQSSREPGKISQHAGGPGDHGNFMP